MPDYPFDISLDRIDENGAATVDGKWWPDDEAAAMQEVVRAARALLPLLNLVADEECVLYSALRSLDRILDA